ncbi:MULTISPECIES: hypothetical protein [Chryseobacterium group]|jgi:hypothetical protein|uniref:Uncharacterized protein n=4 Tax=Chryseobacterium TaxID=59732 RepID=A0AAJ1R3H7_9FLAO|nr:MULTISPECIES: hypothetical protein [Chryseobacterium group]EFK33164.1 hypothetical protein HMPREF0204_12232 [Chryseobacterium gleum ATCC 35910]MDN4013260.1 hypothetical protein [Chryseobacterium gambrini]MDN4028939.1 hypothetical protein [Chryseobacterium gambrini]MDO3425179.1 hypothetical protein [Chryseobacterium sp. APV1]QQY33979.1 hypothetical protein I6I60_09535 [Chryseobacterium gleum]
MTNKALQKLIDDLNNKGKRTKSVIYLRPLSPNVDFAKVWINKPKITDNITSSDGFKKFYFIKNETKTYVAVVLDMYSDLHWYVVPEHRKNGHLTNSMKDVVLFHLFINRDEQTITITENQIGKSFADASKKVALELGFIQTDDNEYVLAGDDYVCSESNFVLNSKMSEDRMVELRNEINYLGRSLWKIQTEIEMNLGLSDYCEELKQTVDTLRSNSLKFEFLWRNNNK